MSITPPFVIALYNSTPSDPPYLIYDASDDGEVIVPIIQQSFGIIIFPLFVIAPK